MKIDKKERRKKNNLQFDMCVKLLYLKNIFQLSDEYLMKA